MAIDHPPDFGPESAADSPGADIAVAALGFLSGDPDRLGRFLGVTGTDPRTIRDLAQTRDFLVGVLDYLLADETLLMMFCADHSVAPETVWPLRNRLAGEHGV